MAMLSSSSRSVGVLGRALATVRLHSQECMSSVSSSSIGGAHPPVDSSVSSTRASKRRLETSAPRFASTPMGVIQTVTPTHIRSSSVPTGLFGTGSSSIITTSWAVPQATMPLSGPIRTKTAGREYKPSNLKRKRKHGFLSRVKTVNGRKTLARRKLKKRAWLSH